MDHYGRTDYLPGLIAALVEETGFLFPPQIFTSILLCFAAGHKHLILRVEDRDVAEVKAIVVRILVTIFGLPTQQIQVNGEGSATEFLHDVFLVPPTMLSFSSMSRSVLERNRSRNRGHYRQESLQRSVSGTSLGKSIAPSGIATPLYHSLLSHARTESNDSYATSNTTTTGPRNRPPSTNLSVSNVKKQRSAVGLIPDDSSIRALRPQSTHGLHLETNPPTPTTPQVSLPPLLSPSEYPPTLGPSLSTGPGATPRLPHALVLSHLERGKRSVQNALSEIIRLKRIVVEDDQDRDSPEAGGDEPGSDSRGRPTHSRGGTWNLPAGFMVVYVCPFGDGRERPQIQKYLLDRFSFCADIALDPNAYSATPGPFRRTGLISREDIESFQHASISTYLGPQLETYMASLLSAVRHHPILDGTMISARATSDYTDLVKASQVIFGKASSPLAFLDTIASHNGQIKYHIPSLSATELDARRMLPFALEHRLRVRKGPHDGVFGSLYMTAVSNGGEKLIIPQDDERSTVQTIIRRDVIEQV